MIVRASPLVAATIAGAVMTALGGLLVCFVYWTLRMAPAAIGAASSTSDRACRPLHVNFAGVSLLCCGGERRLRTDCRHSLSHRCASTKQLCRCYVSLTTDVLNCSEEGDKFVWRDHEVPHENVSSFRCDRPGFPNPHADYYLDIVVGNDTVDYGMIQNLMTAIDRYRVVMLRVRLASSFQLPSARYAHLRRLSIRGETDSMWFAENIDRLPLLETLTAKDVGNFALPIRPPAFQRHLRKLSVDNSKALTNLPVWLKNCPKLRYIRITGSKLTEINTAAELLQLTYLNIRDNLVAEFSLNATRLVDFDVSSNRITRIDTTFFRFAPALRFLDLSNNPIVAISDKALSQLVHLEWLYLRNTHLKRIAAAHFVGLTSLRLLSLEGVDRPTLEPFALMPLSSLTTLDIRRCRLRSVPPAATQACLLQHLWLNLNMIDAFAPEVVVQLSRLSQLTFVGNPVAVSPAALFLLPRTNRPLWRSLVGSLRQSPFWWSDRCAPYIWTRLHLANVTDDDERTNGGGGGAAQRLNATERRTCRRRYSAELETVSAYGGLLYDTRCETARRLRSLHVGTADGAAHRPSSSSERRTDYGTVENDPPEIQTQFAPRDHRNSELLAVSLTANVIAFVLLFVLSTILFARQCSKCTKDSSRLPENGPNYASSTTPRRSYTVGTMCL